MRRRKVIAVHPIEGYSTPERRLEYLERKVKAEHRMRQFDDMPPAVRNVYNAAGTVHNTTVCYNAGCRTFEQAERAIAGVWDGR